MKLHSVLRSSAVCKQVTHNGNPGSDYVSFLNEVYFYSPFRLIQEPSIPIVSLDVLEVLNVVSLLVDLLSLIIVNSNLLSILVDLLSILVDLLSILGDLLSILVDLVSILVMVGVLSSETNDSANPMAVTNQLTLQCNELVMCMVVYMYRLHAVGTHE